MSKRQGKGSECVLETERLVLSLFTTEDAPHLLRLMNEPSWIRFIGDRNVRTISDAEAYIQSKFIVSYEAHGFGFYAIRLKNDQTFIGTCGLVKRDELDDVDIGFALLPDFVGRGYAYEASAAVKQFAGRVHGIRRLLAIVQTDNQRSIALLGKLGLRFAHMIRLTNESVELMLFECTDLEN